MRVKRIIVQCTIAFVCLGSAVAMGARNKAEDAPLHAANKAFNQFITACNAIAETRKYYRDDVSSDVWNQIINQKIDTETAFWEKLPMSQQPYTGASDVHIEEVSKEQRGYYRFVYTPKSTTSEVEQLVIGGMFASTSFVEKSDNPEELSCDKLDRQQPVRIGQWQWIMTDLSPTWLYQEQRPRVYKLSIS